MLTLSLSKREAMTSSFDRLWTMKRVTGRLLSSRNAHGAYPGSATAHAITRRSRVCACLARDDIAANLAP